MNKIQKRRLLNVARALEESSNPDKFTMRVYGEDCGTPACALGHYCARKDLQKTFELRMFISMIGSTDPVPALKTRPDEPVHYWTFPVLDHFGLTDPEADQIFGVGGCDQAQTAAQAATYIRAFVSRKEET